MADDFFVPGWETEPVTAELPDPSPTPATAPEPAPAPRPRPGRRRARRAFRLAAGVVVAVVAAALVVGFDVVDAVDGPAVEVIDRGFSMSESRDDERVLSFGVVVENRTDEIARLTLVRVELTDGADGCCPQEHRFTIPKLLPRQRVGVGATVRISEPDISGIDVTVQGPVATDPTPLWREPEEAVATGDVEVSFSPANEPAVGFTVRSASTTAPDEVAAYAIFRDADGAIIGGTGTEPDGAGRRDPARRALIADAPIPSLAEVEVYAFEE